MSLILKWNDTWTALKPLFDKLNDMLFILKHLCFSPLENFFWLLYIFIWMWFVSFEYWRVCRETTIVVDSRMKRIWRCWVHGVTGSESVYSALAPHSINGWLNMVTTHHTNLKCHLLYHNVLNSILLLYAFAYLLYNIIDVKYSRLRCCVINTYQKSKAVNELMQSVYPNIHQQQQPN